jgi:hypothetical protein
MTWHDHNIAILHVSSKRLLIRNIRDADHTQHHNAMASFNGNSMTVYIFWYAIPIKRIAILEK